MTSLNHKITKLLSEGHATVVFILGLIALLLSCGFLFSEFTHDTKLHTVLDILMPFKTWAVIFCMYGIIKVITSLYRVPYTLNVLNILLGLWLWTYLLIAFVLCTDIPSPVETILIAPILLEVWDFSMTVLNRKCKKE